MAVFRINKTKDYTVMSNSHLKNKEMSLKAKGLLSVMLALPDDWDYSIAGLVAISKEEETAIESTIKELKQLGYLRVDRITPDKSESGRMEYEYNVFEQPQKQGGGFLGVENLGVEFLGVENRPQYNTNKLNTNELNTKNNIKACFVKPSVEEVRSYCEERKNNIDAQQFVDFYESKGWFVGKNKMKDWKACIRTWERNVFSKPNQKSKDYQKHEYTKEVLTEQETPLEMF